MSNHHITVPLGTSLQLLTKGKYCDRDIIVEAEVDTINAKLPESRVTVYDMDGGNTVVTVLVNEGGVLKPKSVNVPNGGSIEITYVWGTPILIEGWHAWFETYTYDDDYYDALYELDRTTFTYIIIPEYKYGRSHKIYAYL